MYQSDPNAPARTAAQRAGEQTLRNIAEQERHALLNPKSESFKTAADVRAVAESRRNAARLAETMRREEEIAALNARPWSADTTNPYDLLSTDELLALDTLTKREEVQKAEFEAQYRSFGQWVLVNPSFPSSPKAAETIVQYCKARNMSLASDNLSRAWEALKSEEILRPDYSNRNRLAHEQNVEEIRAAGIRVDAAPDPASASIDEIESYLRSQPPATLQNLNPPDDSPDLFAISLDELHNGPSAPAPAVKSETPNLSDLY